MSGDIANELPPAGLTWADYVGRWVGDRGGWMALADELIHRAGDTVEIARDAQTVERGLRRLAKRQQKPGGQYGHWMIRFFGFTNSVEKWVKWMGQYHTRFSDLPTGLRLEQLTLWSRPPVTESKLVCWINLGIASAYRSRLDLQACDHWLQRAERQAAVVGPAAEIEANLLRARIETDAGARESAHHRYQAIEEQLNTVDLLHVDALAYRARLHDQRAYHFTKPLQGRPNLVRARELYEAIVEDPSMPFPSFRRSVGLAYCAWKSGHLAEAVRLAERAAEHAGDGGLVRMRVMALNMLSRVLAREDARLVSERARQMATMLEDEDLLRRVQHSAPGNEA